MVEVFKTNISLRKEAKPLIEGLVKLFPGYRITIDTQDCDKVLRIEGEKVSGHAVISLLQKKGFHCSILK